MNLNLSSEISSLKGVGEKRAKILNKLGIFTLNDLIYYFPRSYEDRTKIRNISEIEDDEICVIIATVLTPVKEYHARRGLTVSHFVAADATGKAELTFFNQSFLKNVFSPGKTFLFYGKFEGTLLNKKCSHPSYELLSSEEDANLRLVPIYPLSAGLTRNWITGIIKYALSLLDENHADPIPDEIREKNELCTLKYALSNIHFPPDDIALSIARNRLAFEELFILQLGLVSLKNRNYKTTPVKIDQTISVKEFYEKLPFKLTGAQKRSIEECLSDMRQSTPMSRLLQGDVGSGKTVVAAALAFVLSKSRWQTAMMVPTEILAEQHFSSLSPLFEAMGIKCSLLTGSTKAKEKREILSAIQSGETDFIIGTHALIEDSVQFSKLGLVITDEQHRFGVRQREALASKSDNPHMLVMSATPIPRTLSLIIYSDLDLSVIDELPPGRQKIETYSVNASMRPRIYEFIRKNALNKKQSYIVCSLVSEGDDDRIAVEEYAEKLSTEVFPDLTVGYIHGRLKSSEKEKTMRRFLNGEINLLVSTTVIEVGVDVPNATIMVIENAERFGLSQLHQLRGRVGRGSNKSYCILISDSDNEITKSRFEIMCKTNDGFKIAEEDLRLRGPGDFFGSRQHGLPLFKVANIFSDMALLQKTKLIAEEIIQKDPALEEPHHLALKQQVTMMFGENRTGSLS